MSIFDRLNGNNQQDMLRQIQNDPVSAARNAGYNIPPNLAGNPQAMVQHLIQTGQVSNPMLQRILPMMKGLK